jgi:hypothetical protein
VTPVIKAGLCYFALTFGAGFLLGPLRGLTPEQYFAARDPVSGIAYYLSLVLLASMPLIVERE